MAFEGLTEKLSAAFKKLRGKGVDARCPLTIIPGWCRVAWRW